MAAREKPKSLLSTLVPLKLNSSEHVPVRVADGPCHVTPGGGGSGTAWYGGTCESDISQSGSAPPASASYAQTLTLPGEFFQRGGKETNAFTPVAP